MSESAGLIVIKTNEELDEEARAAAMAALEDEEKRAMEAKLSLVAHIKRRWEAARIAKERVRKRMLRNLRQRNGEYPADKLQAIREIGGSEIYMMLTDEKCNAFESWVEDILLPADDDPWGIQVTPMPELGPQEREGIKQQATQQAIQQVQGMLQQMQASGQPVQVDQAQVMGVIEQTAARIMSEMFEEISQAARKEKEQLHRYLRDHVVQSNWRTALAEVLQDVATYPAGIMKGPFVKSEKKIQWGDDARPVVRDVLTINFERVSPFNIYPSPTSKTIDDGYLFEVHELTIRDLEELRGVDGYKDDEIEAVLQEAASGQLHKWLWPVDDTELDRIQGRDSTWWDPDKKIEALQFWGDIQGLVLLEWGVPVEEIDDPFEVYQVEVWMIGEHVIKAELNGDLLGRKPYHKASFRERNGQFWGDGLPDLIRDVQDACNAAARNLINNMGIASGPQVGIDIAAMARGEQVTKMFPWKIWQFDLSKDTFNRDPIWFYQPSPLVNELMSVYERFSIEADNKSGIPKYAYGQGGSGGASDTASGFSMMMNNASRGVKKVVGNIDRGIISPSIERLYQFLMLYDPNLPELYQGDIQIVARGSTELLAKEQQQVRRNELLQIVLQSPSAQQIVGLPGVAEIFREVVKGLGIHAEHVVPTGDQIRQMQMLMAAQQQAQEQAQMAQNGGTPHSPTGAKGMSPVAKRPAIAASGARSGGADANIVQSRIL